MFHFKTSPFLPHTGGHLGIAPGTHAEGRSAQLTLSTSYMQVLHTGSFSWSINFVIPQKVLIANVNRNELSDSTESGPAPCDKKCCSEHQTLFSHVWVSLGTRLQLYLNPQAPLSQTVPHVVIDITLLVGEKLCRVNNYTPGRGKIVPRK